MQSHRNGMVRNQVGVSDTSMVSSCTRPVRAIHCQQSVMQSSAHGFLAFISACVKVFAVCAVYRLETGGGFERVDASVAQKRDHPLSFHRDKDNRGHS